ncbi:hypothetical protein RW1_056_00360 [Rhodococcus wratislaviensis NBRC 100605]|uniref:Uncharacterized protein n=1 Tax=Rhodococcus wratislaviensis NBRC 100605 TaxID=1219028 RepID=X0PYN1_RHOWR|nr:hypothetical protein RW1_056_00360 [Rhodococcus wratislaviensis NBRC 100605]
MTNTQPDPTTPEAGTPVRCEDHPPDLARFGAATGVTAATARLTAVIGDHILCCELPAGRDTVPSASP